MPPTLRASGAAVGEFWRSPKAGPVAYGAGTLTALPPDEEAPSPPPGPVWQARTKGAGRCPRSTRAIRVNREDGPGPGRRRAPCLRGPGAGRTPHGPWRGAEVSRRARAPGAS
ncbi:hypothetical protein HOK021_33150 [Streptomyces hygroscopicus]|nr:hypothetical protein HOK021_33150 [Streptomyces hygroscopicus]